MQISFKISRLMFKAVLVLFFFVIAEAKAFAEDAYTFTVHGVVKALPGKGLAQNEILVKHEAIPEYRDESGKVVGMMAMTMPFYLRDVASLKDLQVGDRVDLVVEQQLKPTFSEQVISVEKKR